MRLTFRATMYVDADLLADLTTTRGPEGQVDVMLRHLILRCRAHGGAVVAVVRRGEDLRLHVYVGRSLAPARVALLDKLWLKYRDRLMKAQQVTTDTELLAPLHHEGDLLGFLLLDEPSGSVDPQAVELLCKGLSSGLCAVRSHTPVALAMTVQDLQKLELLDVLEAHHGNKSAAAKTLGLTRRGVHLRMDRLGIPRPRRG